LVKNLKIKDEILQSDILTLEVYGCTDDGCKCGFYVKRPSTLALHKGQAKIAEDEDHL